MQNTFPFRIVQTDSEVSSVVLTNVKNPLLPIFPRGSTKGCEEGVRLALFESKYLAFKLVN